MKNCKLTHLLKIVNCKLKINPKRALAVFLAFILLIPGVFIFLRPQKASADWFDDSYAYRQQFAFTHNADISAERAITFSLDTATLITAGAMQTDCDDTRFTDINGKVLRYQLTGTCNNAATTYEVVFPSIISGSNIGIVYYGNPQATSHSENVSSVTALTPSGGDPSITTRTNEEKAPSPALYLKFDEGYGQTANDATTNKNNGTLGSTVNVDANDPAWQTEDMCMTGKCLKFDGTDDYVEVGDIRAPSTAITISFWFKTPTLLNHLDRAFILKKLSASDPWTSYGVKVSSDNTQINPGFNLSINNALKWAVITDNLSANTWYYLTSTWSSGDYLRIYADGVLKGTSNSQESGTISYAAFNTMIAYNEVDNNYFNGTIDDVKIYPYARTASQIKTDYASRGSLHGISASFGDDQSYLSNGLVGWWKMDDGVGNPCASGVDKACDSSGNGNVGTWTNGVASTSGKFGNATSFDGVDDYVNAGNGASLDITSAITIGAWIYTSSYAEPGINGIVSRQWYAEEQYGLMISGINFGDNAYKLTYRAYNGDTIETHFGPVVSLNQWHHVVVTADGTKVILYLDGVGTEFSQTQAIVSFDDDLLIGSIYTGGSRFNGTIDDVRIYNRALSPAEITKLYDWAPGPVGWWKMDENTGEVANDISGNANTGTLGGGTADYRPIWARGKVGSALSFDGVDDYVSTSNQNINPQVFTLSLWFKTITTKGGWLVGYGSAQTGPSGDYDRMIYMDNTGKLFFGVCAAIECPLAINTSLTYNDGNWHHAAATLSSGGMKLYVDGLLAASNETTDAQVFNGYWRIGYDTLNGWPSKPTSEYFNGAIDDVRVYNYARTQKQIIQDMLGGRSLLASGGSNAGPVGSWKFDEGFGTTAHNSGNCGTTCNGTLTGMDSPATYGSGWTNNGKFNKALNFDGTDDYVIVPVAASVANLSQYAVTGWFKADSSITTERMIYAETSTGNNTPLVQVKINYGDIGGDLRGIHRGDGAVTSGVTYSGGLNDNAWHHFAWVRLASNSFEFFVDGISRGNDTYDPGTTSINNIKIGAQEKTLGIEKFFLGSIDNVRVYSYALNAQEIKVDYNRGKGVVMGAVSTNPDGSATNSAARAYCPPGNSEGNCAAGSDPSPVGEWKFDENTGSTANDSSIFGNTGTLTNGPLWTRGKIGSALKFDGVDDYVNLGSQKIGNSNAFAIEGWFKTGDIRGAIYAEGNTGTNTPNIYIRANENVAGDVEFCYVDDIAVWGCISTGNIGINDNNWHHFAAIQENKSSRALYIDGILKGTNTTAITTLTLNAANIGVHQCTALSAYFNGTIDDVRIYNYARTPAQIAWDYNRGRPVGWWKFDEATGASAHDSSGNANHGTITGANWATSGPVGWAYKMPLTVSNSGSALTDYQASVSANTSTPIAAGKMQSDCDDVRFYDSDGATPLNYWLESNCNNPSTGAVFWVKIPSIPAGNKTIYMYYGNPGATAGSNGINTFDVFEDFSGDLSRWTQVGTAHNISSGVLQQRLTAKSFGSERISLPSSLVTGIWEVKYTRVNSGNFFSGFMAYGSDYQNGYGYINYHLSAESYLAEWTGGSFSNKGTTYSYTNDTNPHTIKITRDSSGEHKLYWDGTLKVTATDTTTTTSNVFVIFDPFGGDSGYADYDNIKGRKYAAAEPTATAGSEQAGNTAGKFNSALNFDGTDDYVNITNNSSLNFGTGDFTFSAWTKTAQDCTGNKVYAGRYQGIGDVSLWLGCVDSSGVGKARFSVRDSLGNSGPSGDSIKTINDNQWHHLVGVKNGSNTIIYVDGIRENSGTGSFTGNFNATADFTIGAYPGGNYAEGLIDDVRIYNYALTPTQIKLLYNEDSAIRFGPATGSP